MAATGTIQRYKVYAPAVIRIDAPPTPTRIPTATLRPTATPVPFSFFNYTLFGEDLPGGADAWEVTQLEDRDGSLLVEFRAVNPNATILLVEQYAERWDTPTNARAALDADAAWWIVERDWRVIGVPRIGEYSRGLTRSADGFTGYFVHVQRGRDWFYVLAAGRTGRITLSGALSLARTALGRLQGAP